MYVYVCAYACVCMHMYAYVLNRFFHKIQFNKCKCTKITPKVCNKQSDFVNVIII